MLTRSSFGRILASSRQATTHPINWSRVTKPRPNAVFGALSSANVPSLHLFSVLSKVHWTHRPIKPTRPAQFRFLTIVGGHCVPFRPYETEWSKNQRRALGKKLYVIEEALDEDDD
ncbi:hypothetical protein SPRG_07469 [Saprolegnia parasitica CBS 223.65]|uniref:Uncharacterized protein n=1 Tax=Saprolegnia parasitica (strain CBS 223.65) TaxID=695850 RepID=A0A067CDJ8_SAPPC|nr:hypothetical protein SPRG_07469 [Saprolegnia parasitica CBS 223.65]KDO27220.1 hypothetical protein SPRG_07469 [Saprolegnia parasitica CBS 223.65]|eukprot:XP_012201998.1 hypothetical protein SPRG_07469 [Saprolegnia parasitica CBS 223.65]